MSGNITAFDEGLQAKYLFVLNGKVRRCPYPRHTDAYQDWKHGFGYVSAAEIRRNAKRRLRAKLRKEMKKK